MLNRRSAERYRVSDAGLISIDEHTSIPCVVYDVSDAGVRLTMLSTAEVPDTFLLEAPCVGISLCTVAWRNDEALGARRQRLADLELTSGGRDDRETAIRADPALR